MMILVEPTAAQGLGSECFSYDHGIGQGVEKLKQISKDHRDRKFQQGAERISTVRSISFLTDIRPPSCIFRTWKL